MKKIFLLATVIFITGCGASSPRFGASIAKEKRHKTQAVRPPSKEAREEAAEDDVKVDRVAAMQKVKYSTRTAKPSSRTAKKKTVVIAKANHLATEVNAGRDAEATKRYASATGRDASAPVRDAGAPMRYAGAPVRDAGAIGRDAGEPVRDAGAIGRDAGLNGGDAGETDVSTDTSGGVDQQRVMASISEWLGNPYAFGKDGKDQGIDCSAFTREVYAQAVDIDLPRSSSEQAQVGEGVQRSDLQFGDLVFFRTSGRAISHVGIYIGDNLFAHASSGSGVTISSLDSTYFNKRYAAARRVTQ